MPPYLPFIEALGQYIRTADMEVLRAQTTTTAPILAALLPELRLRLSETSASWRLPPEQARLRLYEAIGELLAAIANERPLLLLLLDDLHWADPATLDLLCFIVAHQRAARLMALCAYREGEATHPQALERAFATLHRLRVVSGITPTALFPVDVGCLAQGHLGGALEPAASRFLARQSEGNPFFVEELLRSWIESGLLAPGGLARDGSNGWSVANASGIDLPAGILTTIRQRLIRLPTDTLDVLRIAAIVGRAFDVALLAEITGDAPEILEERLAAASRAQLIRTGPAGTFTFAHDKIRECLYAEVTAARRTRLVELETLIATIPPGSAPIMEALVPMAQNVSRAFPIAHWPCASIPNCCYFVRASLTSSLSVYLARWRHCSANGTLRMRILPLPSR